MDKIGTKIRQEAVGVDSGQLALIPFASIGSGKLPDARDLGVIVTMAGGMQLHAVYDAGKIVVTAIPDTSGRPVGPAVKVWCGDPCYVLSSNIPGDQPAWEESETATGYWGACVSSLRVDSAGSFELPVFRLDDGRVGLVSPTRYGDGWYDVTITEGEDSNLLGLVIDTDPADEEDEDWDDGEDEEDEEDEDWDDGGDED